jgi:hypothetical protein
MYPSACKSAGYYTVGLLCILASIGIKEIGISIAFMFFCLISQVNYFPSRFDPARHSEKYPIPPRVLTGCRDKVCGIFEFCCYIFSSHFAVVAFLVQPYHDVVNHDQKNLFLSQPSIIFAPL